jgi:flavodoxin
LGILGEVVIENGGKLYGYWPNEGYDFNESLGIAPNGMFYGLALDEDNQRDESNERIERWVNQLKEELEF